MGDSVKQIAILGSTGSIGQQALDVIRTLPHRFSALALSAGQNTDLLAKQIDEFQPKFVSYASIESDEDAMPELEASARYEILSPEEIASHPEADVVLVATSGKAGLKPTLAAIGQARR